MVYNLYIALSERLLLSYQENLLCSNENRILVTYNSKNIDFNKWDNVIELGEPKFNTAKGVLNSLFEIVYLIRKYKKCINTIEEITSSEPISI